MPQKHQNTKIKLTQFALASLCLWGKKYFLLLSFLSSISAIAQQSKIATIELTDVVSAYVDRPGDLYLLQNDHTLKKFDSLGNLLYEKKYTLAPTIFDPRDGARMFTYQKETGNFSFSSEETKQEFIIEQQYAIEPTLACASGDYHIWLFDQADFSIKRINPSQAKVLAESVIEQKQFKTPPQILFMREYQSFLFLFVQHEGIVIFNNLGIQIKKIPVAEIEYFNFLGEELYFKRNDKLIFHDLFDSSVREEVVDPTCKIALLTDRRQYLIYPNRVDILKVR